MLCVLLKKTAELNTISNYNANIKVPAAIWRRLPEYRECHIWLCNVYIWTGRSPRADQLESSDYKISVSNPKH